MRKYLFLLAVVFLLSACIFEYTENEDNEEELNKIKNVILQIFDEYTMFDVDGIMEYFSNDFLNDGVDYFEERNLWYDRLGKEVEILSFASIQLLGDFAVVSFTIDWDGIVYSVPIDGMFTDLVYLKKFSNTWKIYGNQQQYPSEYSIAMDTYPDGASIYLNGLKLDYTTPYTIQDLSAGNYVIGVYLKGFNEIWEELYVNRDTTIIYYLEEPTYPTPEIFIDSPQNGDVIYEDQFFLSGYINEFLGDYAILNINGNEQTVSVDEFGDFHEYITVYDVVNELFLRATNSFGNTGISEDLTVYWSAEDPTLQIELTWNTDNTDVDLHVWDPFGNYCFYGDVYGIPDGQLQIMDDDGYGPEIFLQQPVSSGTWHVKAHFYEGYSEINPTTAMIEIILSNTSYFYGPYEFTGDGDDEGAWWDIGEFVVE
ncbi:MAG TPA: PEGA domain-containing protein [Candidatus Cloacimonetes bacterium]|nr:PEGA domain-containing protein [Candidatus Cloacimonadota bacterium]HEX37444.1 PEGA domain-containing protein [Candidatus Cloacimonadota bacterium]